MRVIRSVVAACAALLLASPAALAGHGKVGTWELTTNTNGMAMKTKFCMTPEQVNTDHPPMAQKGPCAPQNTKTVGNTFTSDIVCTGEMAMKGHIEMTFSSPEHYTASETMVMSMGGQQIKTGMTMDAKWLTPECTVH